MKTIDQNPTVADEIIFHFKTTDENNYLIDPYKVESVKIYFIERDFASTDQKQYEYNIGDDGYNITIEGNLTDGSRVFRCETGNTVNLKEGMIVVGSGISQGTTISYIIDELSLMLSSPAKETIISNINFIQPSSNYSYSDAFYYKNANCIKTIGDSLYPAWLSTDVENAFIKKDRLGIFEYVWDPSGMREGDYFVCWTWVPKIGQDPFSSHTKFNLKSSNFLSTSSPAHHTKPGKYETLLELYLPEMYKTMISDDDRTPDVLDKFNKSIADGFTLIEDLGNQIVDLLDANGVSEYIITHLSNTLDVKLKSQDPTLWRRQIKEAIPLYKKKGTLSSVKDALSQAGMRFLGMQNYWQVVSPYFYQDSFFYDLEDFELGERKFILSKKAVDVSSSNFKIYLTKYNKTTEDELSFSEFAISESEYGETIATASESILLEQGDIIRFSYYYKSPTNSSEENLDDYIKSLPLGDTRGEKKIIDGSSKLVLPLKNWNVKLISENDPLINSVISTRHPFVKNLVFGKIRTEFPYSENVYNMDQYNGSMRDSSNPCDIDKDFLDPCSYCRSSVFDIDIEVEKLSNDSIEEIKNILTENIPFHSTPKTINLYGGHNEFLAPPVEDYDIIIDYRVSEDVIAGAVQLWFYRNKLMNQLKSREDMSFSELVYSGSMKFFNEKIILFSEDVDLKNLPISENNCILEITSGLNAGEYVVNERIGSYLGVTGALEPLNTSLFNFKLYNILFNRNINITRDDLVELSSNDIVFRDLNIKITDNPSNNYKIKMNLGGNDYNFDIKEILPNNKLLLKNNNNLIAGDISNKTYSILDESLNQIVTYSGNIEHSYRSLVNLNDSSILLKNDNNYLFFNIYGMDYLCKILSYSESEGTAYIDTYSGSNVGSVDAEFRQMLTLSSSGYFSYTGLRAISTINLEALLEILNGKNNSPASATTADYFKEDFAILLKTPVEDEYLTINSDDNYYFISEIDGYNISLTGLFENFGVESGTEVDVEIYRFTKNNEQILENYLGCMSPEPTQCPNNSINLSLDRSGREIVTSKTSTPTNFMEQNENITFQIDMLNGNKEEGKI